MAENEYLDLSKARRWRTLANGIGDNCGEEELFRRVKSCLYKTLRNVCNELPFAELVAAVDDEQELGQLCKKIYGRHDVTDLLIQAAKDNVGTENVLQQFLSELLHICVIDIPLLATQLNKGVHLSAARRAMDAMRTRMEPDIARIAKKLAENPSWKPKQPKSTGATVSSDDNTKNLLKESLIAGFPI